jgi:hypothetical protein
MAGITFQPDLQCTYDALTTLPQGVQRRYGGPEPPSW